MVLRFVAPTSGEVEQIWARASVAMHSRRKKRKNFMYAKIPAIEYPDILWVRHGIYYSSACDNNT
jgi:hypothetical protein